jgi:competence protein ComEA
MKKLFFVFFTALVFSISAFAAVNLNTATKEELETLKGVGPAKAQAILDYRKKSGGFKTTDELNNVPGFGDKTLAKLKNEITVSGKTTVTIPAAAPAKAAPAVKK